MTDVEHDLDLSEIDERDEIGGCATFMSLGVTPTVAMSGIGCQEEGRKITKVRLRG